MRNKLTQRAQLLRHIREFFHQRDYLEVETPLLCSHTVTELHIDSIPCSIPSTGATRYLQTSPEYAMKRLLATGSGPIFEITKAFRDDEEGRYHNPEFTLLEWYRPGFTHHELMHEVSDLMQALLNTPPAIHTEYETAFLTHLQLNPHTAPTSLLQQHVRQHCHYERADTLSRDDCLTLLFSNVIEPHLGISAPEIIYDYPHSQAALAKIRQGPIPVAERFELYLHGHELANGFHELTCQQEQQQRFEHDNRLRQDHGKAPIEIDHRFLESLATLPDCAGVAMGLDRIMMLAQQSERIQATLPFPWHAC